MAGSRVLRAEGAPRDSSAAQTVDALPASQTPRPVLDGTAQLVAHYDSANMLRLAIMLRPPHPDELRQFLEDVQDKNSQLFHRFLSPDEWNERFGPTVEDEQMVVAWAQSAGFTVIKRYNHRLMVQVEAPAGTIEKALHLTINTYRMPAIDGLDERTVYSNDRDPEIPAELRTTVEAVLGLNSIEVLRPGAGSGQLMPEPDYVPGPPVHEREPIVRDADPEAVAAMAQGRPYTTPDTTPPPNGNYWFPTDMWSSSAYDYGALMAQGHCCNPLNNPTTITPDTTSIAIAAWGTLSGNDIVGFGNGFPYLAYNVHQIDVGGTYTCNNSNGSDQSCLEVTMDTEWSLAMANSEGSSAKTAAVYVYQGANSNVSAAAAVFSQILEDNHARIMSTSWGAAESVYGGSTMTSLDHIFSSMAAQGWTLLAASGDQGATGGCAAQFAVQFPASDPNVVGVGGTALTEGSNSAAYEVAWTGFTTPGSCINNNGGSTGGFSSFWTVPSYQAALGFSRRAVPDLALDAFYGHDVFYNGAWHGVGGTSVSAPMFAGFFAQANAYLLAIGSKCGSGNAPCAPMGDANFPLYNIGVNNNAGRSPFYDIVTGCNSNDLTLEFNLGSFCAHAGFDEVTGWGSANMLQLAWAINYEQTAANALPSVSYTGPPVNKWYNTNQTVSWAVNDNSGSKSIPGTGIAGFTDGWDSIPADPLSEPHGGSGNSFYSGPQLHNTITGCMSFVANGCAGDVSSDNVSQGCHTAHVRGWNNQGLETGDTTYGPICFDIVPPVTTPETNAVRGGLQVTLTGSDPGSSAGTGSGIWRTFYSIDNAACTPGNLRECTKYKGPFAISNSGSHTLRFFSQDEAGNLEAEQTQSISVE
jgi:subtilase family serine protease